MSHLRLQDRPRKHRRSDCRKGRHEFGQAQNIGAGIKRQVCEVCGAVSIDLTDSDSPTMPVVSTQKSLLTEVHRR